MRLFTAALQIKRSRIDYHYKVLTQVHQEYFLQFGLITGIHTTVQNANQNYLRSAVDSCTGMMSSSEQLGILSTPLFLYLFGTNSHVQQVEQVVQLTAIFRSLQKSSPLFLFSVRWITLGRMQGYLNIQTCTSSHIIFSFLS